MMSTDHSLQPDHGPVPERAPPVPMSYVVACTEAELRENGRTLTTVNGRPVAIFFNGEKYYALDNTCPHNGGPLIYGNLCGTLLPSRPLEFIYGREGEILECPWHKREIDLEEGCFVAETTMRVQMYDVKVESGEVRVSVR